MMRALYSSVAGLKTHQTKMDVLGNNIANVNTVGFKSTRVTFSTMIYQKTSSASGANAETGKGGINAKQIGLGSTFASTTVSVATGGANESTGNAFDLKLTDTNSTSFFVVSNGSENMFTRAGAFYVDGAGNLCMESTGYTVMGWQVDANGNIKKDTVSPLKVMSAGNQTSQPEYTTKAVCSGILDDNSSNVNTDSGYTMNLNFFDNLGYPYTAKFAAKIDNNTDGGYTVSLTNILDSNGKSILGGVSMGSLFGTGNASNQQGGGVDITDNYVMSAGKSNALKTLARQLTTSTPAASTDPSRTYSFSGATINSILGTTFPDDVTIEYTVKVDQSTEEPIAFGESGYASSIKVISPTGINVTEDYREMRTDTGAYVFVTGTGGQGQGQSTATAPSVDANTNSVLNATLQRTENLQSVIRDLEESGTITFTSNGQNQVATIEADIIATIESRLGATTQTQGPLTITKTTTAAQGTTPASTTYSIADSAGQSFTGWDTLSVSKNLTSSDILPLGYLTVSGSAANGEDVFTEKLPSDVEVRYYGDGHYTIVTPRTDGFKLQFSTADGTLQYVGQQGSMTQTLRLPDVEPFKTQGNFSNISIDFSTIKNLANNGSSTAAMSGGDADGDGRGKKIGALTGLSVDTSGKIFGTYDNGNTALLGQIAVARFANASGLESVGENCFKTTLNSGEFDGIGVEIDADGSSITTGVLEMSNVDLATEFTQMITTQRGYQANSRVITTSDSILEELINLKR